jgi:hypothetical protein
MRPSPSKATKAEIGFGKSGIVRMSQDSLRVRLPNLDDRIPCRGPAFFQHSTHNRNVFALRDFPVELGQVTHLIGKFKRKKWTDGRNR